MEKKGNTGILMTQNDSKCKIHNYLPFEYLCATCEDKPLCEKCFKEHYLKNKWHMIQNCKMIGLAELEQAKNRLKLSKQAKKQGKPSINIVKLVSEIREMVKKFEQDIMGAISEYYKRMENDYNDEVGLGKYAGIMEKTKNEENYVKMYQESIKFNEMEALEENKEDSTDELIKSMRKSIEILAKKLMKLEDEVKKRKKDSREILPVNPNTKKEIIRLEEYNALNEIIESYKENQIVKLSGNIKIDDMKKILINTELSKCKMIHYNPNNDIGDKASEILEDIIEKYSNIETLSICDCEISNEKMIHLLNAIEFNKNIKAFHIRTNKFRDDEAVVLTRIKKNNRLDSVSLIANSISNDGIKSISNAILSIVNFNIKNYSSVSMRGLYSASDDDARTEAVPDAKIKAPNADNAKVTAQNAVTFSVPVRPIEKAFNKAIAQVEFKNAAVKGKWDELGPFKFEIKSGKDHLQLVTALAESAEEIYYGFIDPVTKRREYKGVVLYQDGAILEGHYNNGLLEGEVRKINANLDYTQAIFVAGKLNGKGKHVKADGGFYEGHFKDNNMEGEGFQRTASGDEYKGQFAHGKPNGKGVKIRAGNYVYEGVFIDGLLNGEGKYYEKNTIRSYVGNFLKSKEHGHGVSISKSGDKFEGEFLNGQKHGPGVLITANGDRYEGSWSKGELNGIVIYTTAGGAPTLRKYVQDKIEIIQ